MLFDFLLNAQIMLALARQDPEPVIGALRDTPKLPDWSQWATFLRDHDEVDLSRLTADQRQEVFAAFGPQENMRLYGRGIRLRLAPMLGGDQRRIRLAYSLQFTLRGTPVIRYGEEIGMGDDLSLPDRESIRTPMQWSPLPNAGLSAAAADRLVQPVVADGEFGYEKVNVRAQRNDPDSLLSWFERMMRTLRECPEINTGTCTHVNVPTPPGLLVHRADDTTGTMLFLHNLGEHDATVDVSSLDDMAIRPPRCSPIVTTATSTWLSPRSAVTATAGSACAGNCPCSAGSAISPMAGTACAGFRIALRHGGMGQFACRWRSASGMEAQERKDHTCVAANDTPRAVAFSLQLRRAHQQLRDELARIREAPGRGRARG